MRYLSLGGVRSEVLRVIRHATMTVGLCGVLAAQAASINVSDTGAGEDSTLLSTEEAGSYHNSFGTMWMSSGTSDASTIGSLFFVDMSFDLIESAPTSAALSDFGSVNNEGGNMYDSENVIDIGTVDLNNYHLNNVNYINPYGMNVSDFGSPSSQVPEPSSLVLFAIGAMAMALRQTRSAQL